MDLNYACNRFLNHCKSVKKLSGHTCRAYNIDLEEFSEFQKKRQGYVLLVNHITKEEVRLFIQHLFDVRDLKETSVKRKIACLKVFFRWLEMEELIESSPFHKLDTKITLPKRLPRNIPFHELKLLFSRNKKIIKRQSKSEFLALCKSKQKIAFRDLTTKLSAEMMFATGIRVSELVSITLAKINISDKSIHINGKGKRERRVFILDKNIIWLLQNYVRLRSLFKPDTDVLMINSNGNAASTQYIRGLIKKAGEEAGLCSRVTPHRFRHSCATQLLEAGVDIRFVQKLLGHSSISTTEIYTQVCDSALKAVIGRADTRNRLFRVSSDN